MPVEKIANIDNTEEKECSFTTISCSRISKEISSFLYFYFNATIEFEFVIVAELSMEVRNVNIQMAIG